MTCCPSSVGRARFVTSAGSIDLKLSTCILGIFDFTYV
jgi:hypothetical protein